MSDVLRLLRISQIVRMLPYLAGVVAAALGGYGAILVVMLLLSAPAIGIFLLATRLLQGGRVDAPTVRRALLLAIVGYLLDAVLFAIALAVAPLRNYLFNAQDKMPGPDEAEILDNLFRTVPLVTLLVPAVLGAWIDGRKRFWRWGAWRLLWLAVASRWCILPPPAQTFHSAWRASSLATLLGRRWW